MSVVADFTVPAESFVLDETLTAESEMAIESERLASHSTQWVFPFHWASGGDFERFEAALDADPTVASADAIEEASDGVLYQIEWTDPVIEMITEITNRHGSILEAAAKGPEWRLQMRFSEEGKVTTFQEEFAEKGRSFEVNRIATPTAARQREYGLTAEQRDTLVTAHDRGYFEIPRKLTIVELADELDVSSNAVSQRIRRGSQNLVEHTLTIGTGKVPIDE